MMKIAFFDTKPYDRTWFELLSKENNYTIKFYEPKLNWDTASLTKGFDVVCAFVNDIIDKQVIDILYSNNVKLLVLRCAGYNNVDFKYAYGKIHVMNVPNYSSAAVAEHAAALLLSVNRKIHRAYNRTKDNNFNINGLIGMDLKGKTAGIIGTGKIGQIFIDICHGFGMDVIAYDIYPAKNKDIKYVPVETLFEESDIISLHCPLTEKTRYIINSSTLSKMKPHTIIINTSRGGLINTTHLIEALKNRQIGAAALDVYEEESEYFFEDYSNEIVEDDELSRLLSFPNVLVTSHQGFFTQEAMQEIAIVTVNNIRSFELNENLLNEVCYQCTQKQNCPKKNGDKRCF